MIFFMSERKPHFFRPEQPLIHALELGGNLGHDAHLVKDVLPEVNAGGDLGEDHPAVDQTEHRAFGYEQDLLMGILRKLRGEGDMVTLGDKLAGSAIANGYSDSLLIRAADVCIKECRKVVLMPREMPLSRIHLRNMSLAAEAGCVIVPPMLTFYNGSKSVDDMINHALGKALMQFGIVPPGFQSWRGGRLSKEDK